MSTTNVTISTRSLRRRDPSDARTWMTRGAYTGPSLHNPRRGKEAPRLTAPATEVMDEAAITALPESSDDEDEENNGNAVPVTEVDQPPPKSASPKRQRPRDISESKSKRRRKGLSDAPDVTDQPKEDKEMKTLKAPELDMFASSASQKRWQKYGRKLDTNYDIPSDAPPSRSEPRAISRPGLIPNQTSLHKGKGGPLNVPDATTKESERPKKALKVLSIPDINSSATVPSSGASQATSTSERPGDPEQSIQSPLSSPLTTPTSTKFQELEEMDEEKSKPDLCPYCEKPVNRLRLKNATINLIELRYAPIRRQQDFCREHSLEDAKSLYSAKHYPPMKWHSLQQRVTKHIPKLKQIIHRETPSHFLTQLDAHLATLTTNRRQIRQFLDQHGKDADAFPPGYYGPKGTQIMAEVVATKLSHCLRGKDVDASIKALGVGAYIAFVLVPECTTLLVMEDMKVADEAEARAIMVESSQAGMLLHPEDEVVAREDEEDCWAGLWRLV